MLFGAMSNAAERIAFPRRIEPRTRVSIVKLSFDSDCQGLAASYLLTESGTQFEIERCSGKRQREKGRKGESNRASLHCVEVEARQLDLEIGAKASMGTLRFQCFVYANMGNIASLWRRRVMSREC